MAVSFLAFLIHTTMPPAQNIPGQRVKMGMKEATVRRINPYGLTGRKSIVAGAVLS